MKYLLLFDRKFPFLTGEAFLENEIEEIAAKFDKVVIFPIDASKENKLTRTIKASNVDIKVFETSKRKTRQIKNALASPFFSFKSSQKKITNRIIDGYFWAAVDSQTKKALKEVESYNFTSEDTIYLYSYWLYTTAGIAGRVYDALKEKGLNCKVFSRAHRFDIYEEKRKYGYLPCRKELLDKMEKVYACSDDGREYLANKYPEYKDEFEASYLGTYDHGIGKSGSRKPFKLVSCSRVSEVKRLHLIVEALAGLKESGIEIEWTHLGGGDLLDTIKNRAAVDLSFMKYHLDGAVPNSAVYDYYLNNEADLFVNVSSSEGLPVSIIEATSFGIPVIATDVGGTCEIVKTGISGHLISEDFDVDELTKLIERYASMEDEEYIKLRESTRKMWEDYYQAPQNYALFVDRIQNL